MKIKSADFVISVAKPDAILKNTSNEFAVIGKSNVGKSTFINSVLNNKKIAKSSSKPGCTRLINYFKINYGDFYFFDITGYGYATVSKEEKIKWGKLIETYLTQSPSLKHVFFLVDVRHKPSEDDMLMMNYFNHYRIPFTVIANKTDKLSKNELVKAKKTIYSTLGLGIDNIIDYSGLKNLGRDKVYEKIDEILSL